MLIDWFTVGAQVLNFLILVWLLKRFLYQPILDAIDAREQRVAAELADAAAKQQAAQRERDEFQHKNQVFDEQREALLLKAEKEAELERQRLLEEAQEAMRALSDRHQDMLKRDADDLKQSLGLQTRQEVFAIARKTLADLAATSLEERMTAVLVSRLRALDADARAALADALESSSGPVLVRSAFDLSQAQQESIKQALHETFGTAVPLRFETAPALISGIELSSDGQKLTWSIAGYLAALEKAVEALVATKPGVQTPSVQTPSVKKAAAGTDPPATAV
ncbi:MAG: F0F1 ATP synthase subunit delta [Pseudomonadales bacterium]|nr:F0F1 ATP synthase subunit delta [Pseudomonadales bacterium]